VRLIIFPPTGGIARIDPVCGLVAGTGKAVFVHKGFEIIDRMVVDLLPVPGEDFGHAAQDVGGQRRNTHPGEDQKPGVVGRQVQIFSAHIC